MASSSGPGERSQDWDDFQAGELQNAIERSLLILRSRCMKAIVVFGIFGDVALFGGSWKDVLLSPRLLVYVLAISAHVAGPRLRRLSFTHPLETGCSVQLVIMVLLFSSSVLLSIRMKNELMQHRVFLTAHMVHMVLLQCVTYFPLWFNVCVATPVVTLTWFSFHAIVGFWSVSMVIFAIFYNVVLPLFIAHLMEKLKWQQFQANRHLTSERKILEDTQATLHSMLSSQWDASCTCNEKGWLLSSTPHLEQLLGGQDLIGCGLCSFAAGDADAARLAAFLHSIASSVERQALTLQCTVRPMQDSPERGCRTRPFEVSFYGIRLPPGARFQSTCFDADSKSLFIGVKAIGESSELNVGDASTLVDDENLDEFCVDARDIICDDEDGSSESDAHDGDDANIVARSQVGSRAGVSSTAGTTFTGQVFGQIANAEKKKQDFTSRLEAIVGIGAKEHWLVSTAHVQLLPEAVLGVGGYGVVVLGLVHGTHAALKLPRLENERYSGQSLRALVNELRILRHVRHPNCVSFHGACIDAQSNYVALVFEFVQGRTLQAIVGNTESLPTSSDRLSLVLDVCCAIRYLHALSPQIVHGDLKPANVLVEEWVQGFRAKVLDFGLSRLLAPNHQSLGGTIGYMAPEVILRSYGAQGASADVFSFGRLTYFIVSGMAPFPHARADEIRAMARRGFFDPLTWPEEPLCRECEAMCNETLNFDASSRPKMISVHGTILAWDVPQASRRPVHKGDRNPVEWLDGLKIIQSAFDQEEIYAFVDLVDADLLLFGPSAGWTSFFGDTPPATRKLADSVLVDPEDPLSARLQSWANHIINTAQGSEVPAPVELLEGYVKNSKGQVYKALLFVSFAESVSTTDSDASDFAIKVQLRRLRRVRIRPT